MGRLLTGPNAFPYVDYPVKASVDPAGWSPLLPSLVEVKAPISGIFYRAPSPGAGSLVEVGMAVKKGQAMALLEAMKVSSKIKVPVNGVVCDILGADASTLNGGDLLFVVERA